MSQVGILGGTFDPIHDGHMAVASVARACVPLERVLLVPSRQPPHKAGGAVAPAADRLEMCRLAAAGTSWLEVWDVEVARSGLSYTVDTLLSFGRLWPAGRPFLVLGWDAAKDIGSWHCPQQVLALASLVVISRPGLRGPSEADLTAAGLEPERTLVCRERTPSVNATEVRRLAREGRSLDGMVPPAVAAYIVQHRLYASDLSSRPGGLA